MSGTLTHYATPNTVEHTNARAREREKEGMNDGRVIETSNKRRC